MKLTIKGKLLVCSESWCPPRLVQESDVKKCLRILRPAQKTRHRCVLWYGYKFNDGQFPFTADLSYSEKNDGIFIGCAFIPWRQVRALAKKLNVKLSKGLPK